ncbi:DUF6978 family protein [Halococcus sp. AFM35]|uniref:DUF6978 family protein n=1 Tax=Halococcus sp. AFM35 TaxID=3421653 RepID=UPI003EBFBFF6
MLTKAEVDRMADMEKVIEEDWEWGQRGPNLEAEATVYCIDEEFNLLMKGWMRESYGFTLLYRGSKIVRRWDDSIHTNPNGERLEGSHKHYWDGQHEDRFAYKVDDIATDDVDEAFMDFLNECNIELRGNYDRQKRL